MQQIHVNGLCGVTPDVRSAINDAMTTCTNGQRLAVCLLFMSDLPDDSHHLSDIERNLRLIFPPSIPHDYVPDSYIDFQATTIRFYFNRETMFVKNGEMLNADRLWINVGRGYWRNTDFGNRYALATLRDREIGLTVHDRTLSVGNVPVSEKRREYLDEASAEKALAQRRMATPRNTQRKVMDAAKVTAQEGSGQLADEQIASPSIVEKSPSTNQTFAEEISKLWAAYERLSAMEITQGPLNDKTQELVKLALAIGTGDEGTVHAYTRKAILTGVAPDEIRHVVLLSVATVGFPAAQDARIWVDGTLSDVSTQNDEKYI